MTDYKQTRDAAGEVTTQYDKMLRSLDDDLVKRLRQPTGLNAVTREPVQDKLNMAAADRIEELEAKLAKAVEALGGVIGEYDLFREDEYERGLAPLDDEIHDARATLAELKGQDDE